MKVYVERCWSGGDRFTFRLIFPGGEREFISAERWTRTVASEALDIAERLYGANRRSVRFIHR